MQKLGVIGGMGPEATSYFYDQVVRHTDAACDQEHLDMVILSVASMPDRTRAIETGETAPLLAKMGRCTAALEALGCAHIAIPCNTSHVFYDEIQATTRVPIIHMPRETVRSIVERHAAGGAAGGADTASGANAGVAEGTSTSPLKIGIMGTDGTVSSGVYHRACAAFGAQAVVPDAARQRDVMSLIYDDVKAGKEPDLNKFDRVLAAFDEAGCSYVILACTELSVLQRYRAMPAQVVDAMDVLVRVAIERSGAPYRP